MVATVTNILPVPERIMEYGRTGETTYRIPIDKAMDVVAADGGKGMDIIMPRDPNAPAPEVMAKAEAEFKRLMEEPRPAVTFDAALAAQGKALFTSKICATCHSIDGSKKVGPSFKNLVGRATITTKAEVFRNDKAYFIESIKQPQAKVSQAYGGVMPMLAVTDVKLMPDTQRVFELTVIAW